MPILCRSHRPLLARWIAAGRRSIDAVLWLLLASIAVQYLLVDGLFVPVVVSSGSMAPTLLGPHLDVECRRCGVRYACDAEAPPPSGFAVCPNCGQRQDVRDCQTISGDRVLVDRTAFALRAPRRWELAVFRSPDDPREIAVKRIVGLASETVEIRGGDVYINGQLAHKSLAEFRALAIEVSDGQHFPLDATGWPMNWHSGGGGWQFRDETFTFDRPASATDERRLRFVNRLTSMKSQSALSDDLGYNQNVQQPAVPAVDWLLDCRLQLSGPGTLTLCADSGRGRSFYLQINPAMQGWQLLDAVRLQTLAAGTVPAAIGQREIAFTLGLFDGQVFAVWDGIEALHYVMQPSDAPLQPSAEPLAFLPDGVAVRITRPQIFRDVYYRSSGGGKRWNLGPDQPVQLAADEYCLLGDNSLISDDSRTWTHGPAVAAKLLLGRPWLLHRSR